MDWFLYDRDHLQERVNWKLNFLCDDEKITKFVFQRLLWVRISQNEYLEHCGTKDIVYENEFEIYKLKKYDFYTTQ